MGRYGSITLQFRGRQATVVYDFDRAGRDVPDWHIVGWLVADPPLTYAEVDRIESAIWEDAE